MLLVKIFCGQVTRDGVAVIAIDGGHFVNTLQGDLLRCLPLSPLREARLIADRVERFVRDVVVPYECDPRTLSEVRHD